MEKVLTIGVFSGLGINGSYIVSIRTESRNEHIKPILILINLCKRHGIYFSTYVHHENLLSLAALTFLSAFKCTNRNQNKLYLLFT